MASVKLEHVYKKYEGNEKYSVKDVSFYIPDGEFAVFLGPSGCGKSTTLRMIAGLEEITDGNIYIGDRLVNDLPPGERKVAMVFQNYALYPTMTVRENIEFGLINNKVPKEERDRLIKEISQIVSLDEYMDRKPSNLSGGQRQRVALARAMVKKPDIFILDEPLSNLDAKLRVQMRAELKRIHENLGTTFIYVTHDQVEAMSMGTQIIVLSDGEVMQDAAPHDVYNNPANVFTAKFIGSPPMNIIDLKANQNQIYEIDDNRVRYIGFRPEDMKIVERLSSSQSLSFMANVINVEPLGSETIYLIENEHGRFQIKNYDKDIYQSDKLVVEIDREDLNFFDDNQQLITDLSHTEDKTIKRNVEDVESDSTSKTTIQSSTTYSY